MYNKPEFIPQDPAATAFELIEREVFGTFVTAGPAGLVVSHLVFIVKRGEGPHGTLESHLATANEHAELVRQGLPSVAIFMAEHGYISSSWYPRRPHGRRDNAPTWNFATVHCHGRPEPMDTTPTIHHIRDVVERLEIGREDRWYLKELGPEGMPKRLPRLLGFRLPIERLEVKLKMGQDEPLPDTRAAIERLDQGIDPDLAARMRTLNADRSDPPE